MKSAGIFFVSLSVFSFSANGFAAKLALKDLPFKPLPKVIKGPPDNPTTPAKVHLGQQLFHDPRLSKDGTLSCASCHNVMGSGGDNRAFSVGVNAKRGGRSSPTVWNSALHTVQFWDGRAATLEEQAKGPILNPVEMAMDNEAEVLGRLKQIPGYVDSFKKVFGGPDPVTFDNVAKAIAAYERTLLTPSPFDRYLAGNKKAISPQAERGFNTIVEVGCVTCHNGVNFNGPDLPIGQAAYQKFPTFPEHAVVAKYGLMKDRGRADHTKNEDDAHFWRVPTWRNVAITAPYFHNGSVKTLEEAVKIMAQVQLNKELTDNQVADIVAFLNSLTGAPPKQTMPVLPPVAGRVLHPGE